VKVASNAANPYQTRVQEFAINPGRHLQVIKFKEGEAGKYHYYLQVNGKSGADENDFSTGAHTGALRHRPSLYVPIKVPLYNEQETKANTLAQKIAEAANSNPDDADGVDFTEQALFDWVYRPELSFSVVDLEVQEILRENEFEEGEIDSINIIEDTAPTINSSDDVVKILFELSQSEYDRITPLDGEQEFILAIGEQEFSVNIDKGAAIGQEIVFNNLEHLSEIEADDYLSIRLYLNKDSQNVLWKWAFGSFGLVADVNRDNKIISKDYEEPSSDPETPLPDPVIPSPEKNKDTSNSKEYPLLVWVNDDDDTDELVADLAFEGTDTPDDDWPDADDTLVDGMRDLVDFFPVYLNVSAALESFNPTYYTYKLKEATGSLNYFVGKQGDFYIKPYDGDHSRRPYSILTHQPTAKKFEKATVTKVTAEGIELADEFLLKASQGEGGVIYIEASNISELGSPIELILDIENSSTGAVEGTASLWVQARPVQQMFRHINLQGVPGLRGEGDGQAFASSELPLSYPDERSNPDYFVFLHGFNVSGEKAKGWHAETFKRLYQLGFNGRFVGITWNGSVGMGNYHDPVYNAFSTSTYLKSNIAIYTPGANSVTVAAHSLGNMVVSNAIANEGLNPTRYYMLDAAVPIEAYDPSQLLGECNSSETLSKMSDCMRENDWKEYPEALYSSKWHKLFEGGDDPRQSVTWKGLFSSVLSDTTYNFYSPGEDVLENGAESEDLLDTLTDNWSASRHAWVNQEIGKGCQNVLFWEMNAPCSAGWKFNGNTTDLIAIGKSYGSDTSWLYRKLTAEEAKSALALPDDDPNKLTNEHLAQYGFFNPFAYDELYAPITPGNELRENEPDRSRSAVDKLLKDKTVMWDLLAHAIPARSFAAGANSIESLEEKGRSFNMETLRDEYWPSERIVGDAQTDYDWHHSDISNMAMPYVYQVYEVMLDKGNLREEQQ
jgi:hypothetical protein